jgi:hypothetical protein
MNLDQFLLYTNPDLLHCHAGCTLEDIFVRFNLTVADLMPAKSLDDGNGGCVTDNPTHHTDAKTKEQLPIVEVYDYPDADVDYFYAVGRAPKNGEGRQ